MSGGDPDELRRQPTRLRISGAGAPVVSLSLAPDGDARRVHLDEADWVALFAAAAASVTGSPVAPIDGVLPGRSGYDDDLLDAAALAVRPAAIRVELATTQGDRGVLAVIGCDGRSAAGVVRVVAMQAHESFEAAPVPGVELSTFPAEQLVSEVLRTFPPDGVVQPLADGEPDEVVLPQQLAAALTRALQQGDDALARDLADRCGWPGVPDLVRAVSGDVRASAAVTVSVVGASTVRVQRWLQCRLGWVEVESGDGETRTRVRSREHLREALVGTLTSAFDVLLSDGAG